MKIKLNLLFKVGGLLLFAINSSAQVSTIPWTSSGANTFTNPIANNVGIGTTTPNGVLHTIGSGIKTSSYSSNILTNVATSSTSNIVKSCLEIQSTGTWNGSLSRNVGLYISSVTGGTINYDALFMGGGNIGMGTSQPQRKLVISTGFEGLEFHPFVGYSQIIAYKRFPTSNFIHLVLQDASGGNVGIGTINPSTKLEVNGQIKINGGAPGDGKVLTSDATGKASWTNPSILGWSTTGNAGTVAGTNFIGTSDNIDVVFKSNNIESIRLQNSGDVLISTNIGIGTNPLSTYKLAVCGAIKTKKLVVETLWCDFVFDEHYELMSLDEVKKYININKHLPNIPTAKEVETNGGDVGELVKLQMQKIEELTLYVIQLKEENEKIKKSIETLTK